MAKKKRKGKRRSLAKAYTKRLRRYTIQEYRRVEAMRKMLDKFAKDMARDMLAKR